MMILMILNVRMFYTWFELLSWFILRLKVDDAADFIELFYSLLEFCYTVSSLCSTLRLRILLFAWCSTLRLRILLFAWCSTLRLRILFAWCSTLRLRILFVGCSTLLLRILLFTWCSTLLLFILLYGLCSTLRLRILLFGLRSTLRLRILLFGLRSTLRLRMLLFMRMLSEVIYFSVYNGRRCSECTDSYTKKLGKKLAQGFLCKALHKSYQLHMHRLRKNCIFDQKQSLLHWRTGKTNNALSESRLFKLLYFFTVNFDCRCCIIIS